MALFSKLGRYNNLGILLIRAGIGGMMMFHGLPKLTHPEKWAQLGGAMSEMHIAFFPAFWGFMCAVTEAIGGLFTVIGLWLRLVSIFMIINFIVAALHHFNAGDGLKGAAEAIELGFAYLGLLFIGAGKYSVDKN